MKFLLTEFACLKADLFLKMETLIGIERFRIFGAGGKFRIFGGQRGPIPSRHTTSCAHKVFNRSVPDNDYISHL